MNIFILDSDPKLSAQYHFDKHVIKMIVETAQLLSTVNRHYDLDEGYRFTHLNHPSTIWLRQSLDNWKWARELAYALNDEYKYRYESAYNHNSYTIIRRLSEPPIESKGITPPNMAMPIAYHMPNRIASYRLYYMRDKYHLEGWRKRPIPHWWIFHYVKNESELLLMNYIRDKQLILPKEQLHALRVGVRKYKPQDIKPYLEEISLTE